MKKNHIVYYWILAILFIPTGMSCKKMVGVDPPIDQVISNSVFTDDQRALSAISGLYSEMMRVNNALMSAGVSLFAGLSADEFTYYGTTASFLEIYQSAITATNSNNNTLWRTGYGYLYQANSIIEGVAASEQLSSGVKSQLMGEAKFMRAYILFCLSALYGDIPLVTSTDYRINALMGRTPVAAVYDQLVIDLKDAQSLLPLGYVSNNRGRPNRSAATALLARVYLYQKDWMNAEVQATAVINNTADYTLLGNLSEVFLMNSRESIFQLQPVTGSLNTYEANTFVPASTTTRPTYVISSTLLNAFGTDDKRKANWLKSNTVSGVPYYYPYKYRVRTGGVVTENYTLLRLAEQYLIRSEARAMLLKISGSDGALADINVIRQRAGLPTFSTGTPEEVIQWIENERRVELFVEWGHRWLDLARYQKASLVLAPVKGDTWQPTDVLYPVPQAEIDRNPFLTQNAGY